MIQNSVLNRVPHQKLPKESFPFFKRNGALYIRILGNDKMCQQGRVSVHFDPPTGDMEFGRIEFRAIDIKLDPKMPCYSSLDDNFWVQVDPNCQSESTCVHNVFTTSIRNGRIIKRTEQMLTRQDITVKLSGCVVTPEQCKNACWLKHLGQERHDVDSDLDDDDDDWLEKKD